MMKYINIILLSLVLMGCYPTEDLNVPVRDNDANLNSQLDRYIQENFTEEYNMAIRYRYVDNYVEPTQRATPPQIEVVRPMLDFLENFWIDSYLSTPNGEEFFREHVPPEIILIGGPILQNGLILLGTADAGAQITLTDVNSIDPENENWRDLQLGTIYHEFAHIIHQRYKLPTAFETISPRGYTSAGSWFILNNQDAISRGFVSPYGTSSPNEDFAEFVAFYLFRQDFHSTFIEMETCTTDECLERNEGRLMLQQKLSAISEHYLKVTGIDLADLREVVQSKL